MEQKKKNQEQKTENKKEKQQQRENRKYLRTRLFFRGENARNGNKMKKGLNTLTVVSLNPDHFITDQVQQDITQQLTKNKVHIAIIQETHIPRNIDNGKNGYRIITSAAVANPKKTPEHDIPGKYIAGMAIAVHQEMAPHISTIQRVDNRSLKITLDRPETHTPLTIIETYAPHQGYSNHEKNKHWEAVRKNANRNPKT